MRFVLSKQPLNRRANEHRRIIALALNLRITIRLSDARRRVDWVAIIHFTHSILPVLATHVRVIAQADC
jgi:hypothetical protein